LLPIKKLIHWGFSTLFLDLSLIDPPKADTDRIVIKDRLPWFGQCLHHILANFPAELEASICIGSYGVGKLLVVELVNFTPDLEHFLVIKLIRSYELSIAEGCLIQVFFQEGLSSEIC
jgi:hypothetical protein